MKCLFAAAALATMLVVPGSAQPPQPKPGPEHDQLKKLVGNWDMSVKMGPGESKGNATYKMDLGGLWLVSNVEMDMGPAGKFQGHGLDSFDANKKKFVGVWFDSISTSPLVMEGTYDKDKKALTRSGEGPGMDGKPTKHTMVSEWVDDDNFTFKMFHGTEKEPSMTIMYKRKK